MIDIHCHILHDVDDGSRSIDESISMLKAARRSGVDHIVCTPHCRGDRFNQRLIESHYVQLCEYACDQGIRLDLGYEVYWAELVKRGIETAPSLCIANTNLLLLEFSAASMPANWQSLIYKLQGMGLRIIIAHPERYLEIQKDIDIAREMHDMGCLLQLSANYIEGGIASPRKRTAVKLQRAELVDYVASDAHRPEHYEVYRKAMNAAAKASSSFRRKTESTLSLLK